MPDETWEEAIHAPHATHPLEGQTQLYVDLSIALRVLSLPYSQYLALTTPNERYLYRLFLILEAAKERHHREQAEQFAEAEREAQAQAGQTHARG